MELQLLCLDFKCVASCMVPLILQLNMKTEPDITKHCARLNKRYLYPREIGIAC